jgi:hypothetical protein
MNAVLSRRVEITRAVSEWFQELLVKAKDTDESIAMPEEIYVEMWTRLRYMIPPGEVCGKWRITRQEIAALPVAPSRPQHVSLAVGYYRIAWGEFSISEDDRFVTIGFKLGPKCGRGDVYEVISNVPQRITLERVKPAWTL